jgi:hypothetical protein
VLVVFGDAAHDVYLDRYRGFAEIVTACLGHRRAVALVRPDGYLAAVWTAGDTASIHEYVREQAVSGDSSASWAICPLSAT